MLNLFNELKSNPYPGRGIVLGMTKSHAVMAYFIMGRSANSRNRVFVEADGGIRTQAFDPALLQDPSLIIYAPVRVLGKDTIVTNGDQTDTVADFIKAGKTFEEALRTRTFEPDAPNYTPRISGLMTVENGSCSYRLSILKSNDGNPDSPLRFFYEVSSPIAGEGHFIHTYRCDGNPIPSFEGEPKKVAIPDDLDAFSQNLWDSLHADNKVSLFVRFISFQDGGVQTWIINKNQK